MPNKRTRRYKHKSKKQTKGKGLFNMFNRKPTPIFSDKAFKREGDKYEQDGYTLLRHIVDKYEQDGKLAEGYTASKVDAILSKYMDEPRNVDGLQRVNKWTNYLLKSKAYAKPGNALIKEILKLQHISLV